MVPSGKVACRMQRGSPSASAPSHTTPSTNHEVRPLKGGLPYLKRSLARRKLVGERLARTTDDARRRAVGGGFWDSPLQRSLWHFWPRCWFSWPVSGAEELDLPRQRQPLRCRPPPLQPIPPEPWSPARLWRALCSQLPRAGAVSALDRTRALSAISPIPWMAGTPGTT